MNFSMLSLFLLLFIAATTLASDVIVLDTSNFEHLTQASTGATTGDWLVKFYGNRHSFNFDLVLLVLVQVVVLSLLFLTFLITAHESPSSLPQRPGADTAKS